MASEDRFGYEWKRYAHLDARYEHQFQTWISSLTPADFKGKAVLDAGCGMGRNSYWPLTYGAARVVAFDNDEQSLASARRTLAPFKNAVVERHDLSDLPWDGEFDIVICVGVLHHVRRPERALAGLVKALKPGGTLIVWVYSYEGNEWIPRYVTPIRERITSRLPLPLMHALSYLCSVPLWIFLKLFRGPTPYLRDLSQFEFWHVHSIVFDQLIPAVANYWKREEVEALARATSLSSFVIEKPRNGNGWTLHGTK
ncbi:MAG: class I SAM-dependent methyltransferase [Patescibacteria group bacterium]|nr:class I SAM-dependent methyltransferase [Patescibacteria group bacterium]MDE1943988.1 class I SAM-dependent methyltransferase [Patescibacteria group bacterium]MDE1945058.1 class I SAM-dependent methyltransferase [Patescibacteria group bacterium]MDE2057702.1 class I SAM-dependent methyltransferase [Patescibacteria group bacterium]